MKQEIKVYVFTNSSVYKGEDETITKVYGSIVEARDELLAARMELLNNEELDDYIFEVDEADNFICYEKDKYSENHLILSVREQTITLPSMITEQIYRAVETDYYKRDVSGEYENLYEKECPYDDNTLEGIAERANDIIGKNDGYWDYYWGSYDAAIEEYEKENNSEVE